MNYGENSQDNQDMFGYHNEQQNHQDQPMLGVDLLYDNSNNNLQNDNARGTDDGGGEQRERAVVEEDVYRAPKPRLKWTSQLHDTFVRAVEKLGGPSKATPKAILSLMDVKGLSLYHLKSHLQKFRLGKTSKKLLWRKNFSPADYCRRRSEPKNSALYLEVGQGSSSSNPAGIIGSPQETSQAPSHGNDLHQLVEIAITNPGMTDQTMIPTPNTVEHEQHAAANMEEDFAIDTPPSLLPLFPGIADDEMDYPIEFYTDWPLDLFGTGEKSCFRSPIIDDLLMDDYVNSLKYPSEFSDLGKEPAEFNQEDEGAEFVGAFLDDDVASSSKVDDGKGKSVMVADESAVDNKEGCDNLTVK